MPARHNEQTHTLAKKTKELFIEKEREFKKDCQRRLDERLAAFDSKVFGVE